MTQNETGWDVDAKKTKAAYTEFFTDLYKTVDDVDDVKKLIQNEPQYWQFLDFLGDFFAEDFVEIAMSMPYTPVPTGDIILQYEKTITFAMVKDYIGKSQNVRYFLRRKDVGSERQEILKFIKNCLVQRRIDGGIAKLSLVVSDIENAVGIDPWVIADDELLDIMYHYDTSNTDLVRKFLLRTLTLPTEEFLLKLLDDGHLVSLRWAFSKWNDIGGREILFTGLNQYEKFKKAFLAKMLAANFTTDERKGLFDVL